MIDASKMSYDQINALSRKYEFVTKDVHDILSESKVDTVPYKAIGTDKVSLNENQFIKGYDIFDDLVIKKWFSRYFDANKLHINLNDAEKVTGKSVRIYNEKGSLTDLNGNPDIDIDFKNDLSLFNFKLLMENNILPYLKEVYSDNPFINGLMIRRKGKGTNERT